MATVRFVVLTVKNRTCLVSFMMLFVSYMVLIQYMFIECMFLFICCMFPVYVCLFSYFLQSCCFCPCWSLRPRFKWGHSPFSRPSQGVGKVEEEVAWFAARRRVAWFVEQSSHLFYFLDKKVALNKEPLIYIKWGTSKSILKDLFSINIEILPHQPVAPVNSGNRFWCVGKWGDIQHKCIHLCPF